MTIPLSNEQKNSRAHEILRIIVLKIQKGGIPTSEQRKHAIQDLNNLGICFTCGFDADPIAISRYFENARICNSCEKMEVGL